MCPAIPISNIYGVDSDSWNAAAYEALSLAWRTSATVKAFHKHTLLLGLARDVWKLDSTLRDLLERFYDAVEHPTPPVEPVTQDQIIHAVEVLRNIHGTIDRFYTRAKTNGLTNHRLVGAVFNSIKTRSEELLELADAITLSLDPDVDCLLNRSLEDLRSGKEMHDLSDFR